MHLVETNTPLAEAISLCPLSFRGGCIHGVIMEYLDTVQSENISTWPKTVCEPFKKTSIVYKNCFHALGHEFAAKSKENLNGMLLLCKNVPSGYRSDCLYGVLMEFSKGESGSGRHLEIPVGKYTPSCEPLEEDFKITCYTSVGFYGQYEADGESLETTYKKCELLPEIYKQYCFEGIAGALLFSEATDRGSASLRCKVLPSKFINICLTSI